jgi:hypothetical protein
VALGLAGVIGCLVAVVHGILIERRMVKPIRKLVAADTRMAVPTRRLVSPLLHLSTFAWFLGGFALIGAAIWLGREARTRRVRGKPLPVRCRSEPVGDAVVILAGC